MIFASGTAARIWAAGADLGTEVGSVSVGGTQVSRSLCVFSDSNLNCRVIDSDTV